MGHKLTSTDINKGYYLKKRDKSVQIKLHISNLYLWVSKAGKCTFMFKIYLRGKSTWIKLGNHPIMTVSDAVAKSHEMQNKRDSGINPNKEKQELQNKSILLSSFIDKYTEVTAISNNWAKSTIDNYRYTFGVIKQRIGNYYIHEITTSILEKEIFIEYHQSKRFAGAKNVLVQLKSLFKYAIKKEVITNDPTLSVDDLYNKEAALKRNLVLTVDEIREFINSVYKSNKILNEYKYYIHLLILFGARKSELTNATWGSIDWDRKIYKNFQSKVSSENQLPIGEMGMKILKRLQSCAKNNYILYNKFTMYKNIPVGESFFNAVLDSLEFNQKRKTRQEKLSPHDFRRIFTTLAKIPQKYLPAEISMTIGHDIRSQVEKHYDYHPEMLNKKAEILRVVDEELNKLIEPELDILNLMLV
jgi:integrase